jgi:hypothetical protein
MHSRLKKANFTYLLIGLLSVLFIGPLTLDLFGYSSQLLTSLTFSATMIIGVWSLLNSKALFRFGMVLIVISLSTSILAPVYPQWRLHLVDMLAVITFCSMSFTFILADITTDLKVDANRVVGATCLYLLIGLVFGIIYIVLETFLPGSFANLPEKSEQVTSAFFYYSFVTLTTLGYGDITPLRPIARTIAYLEAIVGVFYMAIMIGSMVGLLLNRANAKIVGENNTDNSNK